jgi:glycosyltransferase involved in cell wall biosynthesis
VKKKIVILTSFFCGWNGGVDLISYFIKAISFSSKKYSIYIFIPKNNFVSNSKRYLFPLFQSINFLFTGKKNLTYEWKYKKGSDLIEKYVLDNLKSNNINIIYTDFLNEKKSISKIDPDIIFPVISDNYDKTKAIGYIFDLQHEYFPDFFSKKIIHQRRKELDTLSNLDCFIVNSKKTKKDLIKFHKTFKKKNILSVPFTPNIQKKFLFQTVNISNYYNSNNRYFIICNQFWRHKNHLPVLKVFEKYIKRGGVNNLILTGDIDFVKDHNYIKKTKVLLKKKIFVNRVFYTGNIEKKYQIELLKHSIALIQPSSFEGGPGAGAINEAIALNLPIIASNIIVNKEINYKKINLFNTKQELLNSFFLMENQKKYKIDHFKQLRYLDIKMKRCSDFFIKSFDKFLNFSK